MPKWLLTSSVALALAAAGSRPFPGIPKSYLEEAKTIPEFWVSTVDGVNRFLNDSVRKGAVERIGVTAGGRPMRAVVYGAARGAKGTTTLSGALGARDVRAYLGPDYGKKVYMAMGAVHGGELEGIVGLVNLISVLESGRDLRGREWPGITAAAAKLDRIVLIPITNVDGRARIPFRMLRHWGGDYSVPEYFNTGAWKDGKGIGWPACKQFIPLDFSKTQFPGGYPNDAGVNIQHDDFFRHPQPETRALFDLTARERPDIILNMHTGAVYTQVLREFIEPALTPAFEAFYQRVHSALAAAKLAPESAPSSVRQGTFNLSTALNEHCGALAILIESPSHAASQAKRDGQVVIQTPDELLDAQLICHQEAMRYLAETGGRYRWAAK